MNDMTLGQKIRELRLSKKMTQKELAGSFITRNMLSQIENDSATPSMKTMEYLASELERPIGYFLDKGHSEINLSQLLTRLIDQNESVDYEATVALLEEEIKSHPAWADNQMIMDLFVNSHLFLANTFIEKGEMAKAKGILSKVLEYESNILDMTDIYLYKIYELLAETSSQLEELEDAKNYYNKGKDIIHKIVASREVQSLYIQMMDGEPGTLAEDIAKLDTSNYDPYSLARFHMIAGISMYRNGQFKESISYLEQALSYYESNPKASAIGTIYEQLSKCYSEMDEYKKAYDYLQKAQASK